MTFSIRIEATWDERMYFHFKSNRIYLAGRYECPMSITTTANETMMPLEKRIRYSIIDEIHSFNQHRHRSLVLCEHLRISKIDWKTNTARSHRCSGDTFDYIHSKTSRQDARFEMLKKTHFNCNRLLEIDFRAFIPAMERSEFRCSVLNLYANAVYLCGWSHSPIHFNHIQW